jgi:1,4-dihydroxy-2-naphthoate polyprenyltransferase
MTAGQFFSIVEIRTKIISMGTFFMGTLYAVSRAGTFSPGLFFLTLVSVLCVDMGTTGFNAYFDVRLGTDRAEVNREKNKVLLHQGIDAHKALIVSVLLFIGAGITGIILAWLTSWYLLVAGGVCMAVGYLYTGGPFPISRTPLGELAAGGFLGSVLFMISCYIQTQMLSIDALLVSLSSSAVIASILTANNTCDLEHDAEAGRKTLSILIGRKNGERLVYLLGTGAYLWAAAMILAGYLHPAGLPFYVAGLLLSFRIYGRMRKTGYSYLTKDPIMDSVAKIFLIFALAALAGMGTGMLLD